MANQYLNRLLLGVGAAGLVVTVPTLVQDGVEVTDWVSVLGFLAAFLWKNLPDIDQDGLPDPLEALLRPRAHAAP